MWWVALWFLTQTSVYLRVNTAADYNIGGKKKKTKKQHSVLLFLTLREVENKDCTHYELS